jgi:hypothetical protein
MTPATPSVSRRHRWLLLIPFLWQIGGVPFVNDIAWRPLSLPFPMVWQMAGILVTSAIIAFIFSIDRRHPEFGDDEDADRAGADH